VIIAIVGRCGHQGFSGDGGPATAARLNDPIGITEDNAGNLYIADEQNARVRKVSSRGVISTIAGGGRRPVARAPDGTLATKLKLSHPSYVVVDAHGDVYFSDFLANVVTEIDRSGRIRHVAGTGKAGFSGDGGPATRAELNFPTGLTLDSRGNLFISDAFNNRIRKVDRRGVITTVAGTGRAGYSGDGGPADEARLNASAGLALDARGRLVIADQGNNLVRRVNAAGNITTIAGRAPRIRARSQVG
jgi:sugar lactone lactonase YvrE